MDYTSLTRRNLTLAPLGVTPDAARAAYPCTPKGARIIGWSGVDGIHFCFVRGRGETVFAVSPMNTPGNYVHPVARSFPDFLRLLLACGDAAALEQAWQWDAKQFYAFLQDNPPTAEQRAMLDGIAETFSLTPMPAPFGYLQTLLAEYDPTHCPAADDPAAAEAAAAARRAAPAVEPAQEPELPADEPDEADVSDPDWGVYYDGGFRGRQDGRSRAGQEMPLAQEIDWQGQRWYVPAVYACAKGLVVDLCKQVPADRLRVFASSWGLTPENDGAHLSDEARSRAAAENPLQMQVTLSVSVNGKPLSTDSSSTIGYHPMFPEHNDEAATPILAHYGLDPACGWVICRTAFPWATARKPQLSRILLTLTQLPQPITVARFSTDGSAKRLTLRHPVTGTVHTLELAEQIPCTAEDAHFVRLPYTITPPLSRGSLQLTDCTKQPARNTGKSPLYPDAIGVIGGADGPTVCLSTAADGTGEACSAPRPTPAETVQWRADILDRRHEDCTVSLL